MRTKTSHSNGYSSFQHEGAKTRLDLNDLIRRKKEEEQRDKKNNLLIIVNFQFSCYYLYNKFTSTIIIT